MKGVAASPGIAIGKSLIKKEAQIKIEKKEIDSVEDEIKRLNKAIEVSKQQIQALYQHTLKNIGQEEAKIFEAHMMILDDPEYFGQVQQKIKTEKINAEYALKQVTDAFIEIFQNMDNEYMKERAIDIKDVSDRIIRQLLGIKTVDLSKLDEEVIIIAEDLTPSDTAQMDKQKVIGFITETGGRTSHSAIMARTLEIPAIVGVEGIIANVKNGDIIIFDGDEGSVIINPDKETLKQYKDKKEKYEQFQNELKQLKGKPSITKDGCKVEIVGNIGTPNDIEGLIKNDAEGVGLYRTEFIYMDRDTLPTEEEQFEAYKKVLQAMNPKPVVIRTLDIGGDKEVSYLNIDKEMNPFLGYRAIRLCLDKVEIFKVQLRALLRASIYGNLKIMFPMISSLEELLEAKKILQEVKRDLDSEGVEYASNIEVGMMIEVPSAAIISDILAKEVDFFSIGTNDLIQYTTAVDRMNQKIRHLYNPFNPAVIRLIKMVIDNGHKQGIWVGMCGEMAGDPKLIPILIGMGLDEFSMSPISILRARRIIRNIERKEMEKIANQIIDLPTAEEVERFIDENIAID
ncbi:phosphoenolpyruvate--protein phosphotransferase [Caloranaerobacter azorensis]|uniref:Phosphoenolpyruvate-protein phosphotransferase n=1 Tax=Caloranaerobacter azorensis TaxID=116090 RepID=A0A6P1YFQ1_9FIRM|nr:phosphoenolpyruvate--protein phosphotransferase [Caloranaerobacter azorensis]QIB27593.1 phosphoenolpyruvate--protein phosphotransferase [Caloranaerobacter azorensis]